MLALIKKPRCAGFAIPALLKSKEKPTRKATLRARA